ncbi:hypothetical protein GCM10028791_21910 [Echinicola sediminis]
MNRRKFLRNSTTAGATLIAPAVSFAAEARKPLLTVAHITDVHITPDNGVPERAMACLQEVVKHSPDFFLNGGDSIMDASYDGTSRERVLAQWETWDKFRNSVSEYEMHSCIGNHDPWWDVDGKEQDKMFGLDYVAKRLDMPNRYYSFSKKGWHFIILDGNHKGVTLDDEQFAWLEKELADLAPNTPVLLMSHFPILTVTGTWEGGQHGDHVKLRDLFYQHKDKIKVCLSGHQHLLDRAWYNDVQYYCNGSMSGYWWGEGDERSALAYYYQETPPGYAIIKLYDDGSLENTYHSLLDK